MTKKRKIGGNTTTIHVSAIKRDPRTHKVVPRPSSDQRAALRESIREKGLLLPLSVTTDFILVDGYERLDVLESEGIKRVKVQVIGPLDSVEERLAWCIDVNLHRRHLNDFQRAELGLAKLELVERRKAEERRREGARRGGRKAGRGRPAGPSASARRDPSRHDRETSSLVAKMVGVGSGKQIDRVRTIKRHGTPDEIEAARRDDVSINEAYSRIARRQRDADLAALAAQVDESTLGGEVLHGDGLRLGPPNGTVDLVIVDPPFGTDSLTEEARGGRKPTSSYGVLPAWNDSDAAKMLSGCMARIYELLREKGSFYLFFDRRLITDVLRAARDAGLTARNIVCWRKTNLPATAVRNWGNGFELVVYGSKGEPDRWNLSGHAPNVIDAPLPGGADRTRHPCQKPVELLRRLIGASSNPGDLVVDYMAGSGSTGLAARELKRRFVLVEQDEEYVTAIKGRLAAQAGARSSAAESA